MQCRDEGIENKLKLNVLYRTSVYDAKLAIFCGSGAEGEKKCKTTCSLFAPTASPVLHQIRHASTTAHPTHTREAGPWWRTEDAAAVK